MRIAATQHDTQACFAISFTKTQYWTWWSRGYYTSSFFRSSRVQISTLRPDIKSRILQCRATSCHCTLYTKHDKQCHNYKICIQHVTEQLPWVQTQQSVEQSVIAKRWQQGCQPYASAALYSLETLCFSFWYSFLLHAEWTLGLCGRKYYVNWRKSFTSSGLEPVTFRFVTKWRNHYATVCPVLH
jgi:hypothetical protein